MPRAPRSGSKRQEVAETVHDHLVRHDQHAFAAVLAHDGVEQAAQAQDHVAPAFAARRTEIELADVAALLVQFRVFMGDADRCQAVKDAKFFFAQALVGLHGVRTAHAVQHDARSIGRPHVGRVQYDVGALIGRHVREPACQRFGLLHAQVGERGVDIAVLDVNDVVLRCFRRIARDVARALSMPHQPDLLRPLLFHRQPVGPSKLRTS